MKNQIFKRAPYDPPHWFLPEEFYMLTASTYQREPLMRSARRKSEWLEAFHKSAEIYGWIVIARVILHDHYHAIVRSPANAETLSKFVASYHKFTARRWNNEDNANGRMVWWNYWDTCLLTETDYYTRLRYVFWNPVKHGVVNIPEEYEFSSYRQYLMNSQAEFDFAGMHEEENDFEY
jgi:putative transposase